MTYFLLVALGVVVLILVLRAVRGQRSLAFDPVQLRQQLQPVDVGAFCNLVNSRDEEYLRANLPGREFRHVQRLRARAAAEYVRRAAANARVMLRIAEVARASADAEAAHKAREVVNSAIRLRVYAFVVLLRLNAEILFPGVLVYSTRFVTAYEQTLGSFSSLPQFESAAA
jgi:hypothetical protein